MKFLLQYKKLTAFILLLLQVFISTPVQVYHHHNYDVRNIKSSHQKKYLLVNPSSRLKNNNVSHTTITEICLKCNHQYTAYYNDYIFKDIIVFKQPVTAHYTIYKQSFTSALAENPSNKSPPLTYLI